MSFYDSNDILYISVVFFEKFYYFFNPIVMLSNERYNFGLQVFEFFVQFRFLFRVRDGDASFVLWISLNLLLRLLSVTGS